MLYTMLKRVLITYTLIKRDMSLLVKICMYVLIRVIRVFD